jgi:hypothetical protein
MSVAATAVARYQPVLSDVERMTMLGFLAAYRGYTRDAYTLDLRQFTAGCWQHQHPSCSTSAVSTSNASPATSKTAAGPAHRRRA